MPRQSLADLRQTIESAPEMSAEHRAELLALVDSLEREIVSDPAGEEGERAEKLRGAIAVADGVVRRRAGGTETVTGAEAEAEEPDLGDRLAELEEKAEMLAVEHPVIANVLTAIARLV